MEERCYRNITAAKKGVSKRFLDKGGAQLLLQGKVALPGEKRLHTTRPQLTNGKEKILFDLVAFVVP